MKSISKRHVGQFISLIIADLLLFGLTDATRVASFMIIVGWLLAAASLFYVIYGVLSFAKLYGLPLRRKSLLAFYLTAVLAGLLALQSIGELGSRDIMVLLPLALLAYLYGAYAKNGRHSSSI